jgi:cell division protein FtsB
VAITVGLLAVFFGNQGFRSLVRNYMELRSLKKQIAALETDEKRNTERLRLLRAGDGSVERLARRELGYLRKGEIEYRFPPPAPEK